MVFAKEIRLSTSGDTDIIDITQDIQKVVRESKLSDGIATVSVIGSTGAVTTLEYEPALVSDLKNTLEKLVPSNKTYAHDATWGDANGYSHLRSALLGTSKTFPFSGGKLVLGTWQQIVFIELDNRPRDRKIFVQVIGEK
ncbi:MAG: secondary thiamine-phosphate synthase enzyme YjbQ [Elusimicrobiota bacterium]